MMKNSKNRTVKEIVKDGQRNICFIINIIYVYICLLNLNIFIYLLKFKHLNKDERTGRGKGGGKSFILFTMTSPSRASIVSNIHIFRICICSRLQTPVITCTWPYTTVSFTTLIHSVTVSILLTTEKTSCFIL